MNESVTIEIYRLSISEAYRSEDHIAWPLVDKKTRISQEMLERLVARAQPIFGELVRLEAIERTDGTSVDLIILAHVEDQLEPIPEIRATVSELFTEASEVINLIAASDAPAAQISIRSGNPADSTGTVIFARAPVAELAQILRESLPAGVQPGADLGMMESPTISPQRGISCRFRDVTEDTLIAEIMHVCDQTRFALVKTGKKLSRIKFQPELRTELLYAQLEFKTLNLQVSTNYKLHNGVKKDSDYTLLKIISTVHQQLIMKDKS